MRFINYQIPSGLGIRPLYNTTNNRSIFNGITAGTEKKYYKSNTYNNTNKTNLLQSGGRIISPEPYETVFYIFDYPINSNKDEHIELTDEEELSEEIELSRTYKENLDEEEDKSLNRIDIDKQLENFINEVQSNDEIKPENKNLANQRRKKIRSLKGLFSNKSNDISRNADYDSHDTLNSILNALQSSKQSARRTK